MRRDGANVWASERTDVTERDIIEATEEECSCGGAGPDDPKACPACRVYHRIFNPKALAAGDKANRENVSKAHPKLCDPWPQGKPGGVA